MGAAEGASGEVSTSAVSDCDGILPAQRCGDRVRLARKLPGSRVVIVGAEGQSSGGDVVTDESGLTPEEYGDSLPERKRGPRDPAATLTTAMLVYIFVTLLFALPLVIFPAAFFDVVGLSDAEAAALGGLRWFGAVLLAWAISGILVLARPGGRAIFVTTGALQLTFSAVALLYSWSVSEYAWSSWYHGFMTVISIAGAAYLWWARFRARAVLRTESAP